MSKLKIIIVGKQFAFRLALIAFAVVLLRGLFAGNEFSGTLQLALGCLGLFFVLGYFLGDLARRVIEEHVQIEATTFLNNLSHTSQEII